jgi:fido (protein-threonine AMPylation protein)
VQGTAARASLLDLTCPFNIFASKILGIIKGKAILMTDPEEEFDADETDAPDDNLLGIHNKAELNEEEAKGILRAEEYLLDIEVPLIIDAFLLIDIHKEAFKHLYEWAGKYRTSNPNAGPHLTMPFQFVPSKLYQFMDEVKYRYYRIADKEGLVKVLAYAHHGIVEIHPFANGNGRTARLFTDLLAYSKGYQSVELYHRDAGEPRKKYLQAIRLADKGDYTLLEDMIRAQLREL